MISAFRRGVVEIWALRVWFVTEVLGPIRCLETSVSQHPTLTQPRRKNISNFDKDVRDEFGVGSDTARNTAPKMRGMSDVFEQKTGRQTRKWPK